MKYIVAVILISMSSYCFSWGGDISAVLLPGTVQDHYGDPERSSAVTPQEAVSQLEPFSIGLGSAKQGQAMVLLSSSTAKYTNFGDFESYAYLVKFETPMTEQKMILNGYMVKPEKGRKYILYPLASAYDKDKQLISLLTPLSESEIKGNTLSNVVNVPEGTAYLLLYTHPAFLTFDMSTGKSISEDEVLTGLASVGGALGGFFNGVLFNSQVKRGKVGVAPVGVVEVMQFDEAKK